MHKVGTLRKVFTVVLSFLWFPKRCSLAFVASGLAVLASIAVVATAPKQPPPLPPPPPDELAKPPPEPT